MQQVHGSVRETLNKFGSLQNETGPHLVRACLSVNVFLGLLRLSFDCVVAGCVILFAEIVDRTTDAAANLFGAITESFC